MRILVTVADDGGCGMNDLASSETKVLSFTNEASDEEIAKKVDQTIRGTKCARGGGYRVSYAVLP